LLLPPAPHVQVQVEVSDPSRRGDYVLGFSGEKCKKGSYLYIINADEYR
jgi:hypothetical protein